IETPQSVSVVGRKQIEAQNAQSVTEILRYVPGVTIETYGPDPKGYDWILMRGFNAQSTSNYQDGLRLLSSGYSFFRTDPYQLQSVEVLRGPSSSLYGQSDVGGIVNRTTKKPTAQPVREIELEYGSHDRFQGAFDFSGPIGNDPSFLYRVIGVARDSNTQFKYSDGSEIADDRLMLAPSFTWAPSADTSLTIDGNILRDKSGGTVISFTPTDILIGDPDFNSSRQEQQSIGYQFEHRLNEAWTVRQNVRYGHVDFLLNNLVLTGQDTSGLTRSARRFDESFDAFAMDNQALTKFETGALRHELLLGLDYAWSDYDASSASSLVSIDDIEKAPFYFAGSQKMNQYGLYLHDQIKWNDWTLFASGRQDWVDSDSVDYRMTETQQKDNAFSGRLALSYRTPWGIIPYANYSTSFSPNQGFVYDAVTDERRVAQPTKAEQVELGVKYEIPDQNAVVTMAYFDIRQRDGVVLDGTFDDAGNQRQRQLDLHSRGLELEANASFDNGFGLIASYTYMRMTIDQGAAGTVGKQLSSTPNHIASLWGHYEFRDGVAAGLGLGAGVRYVGESYGDDRNSFKNEARAFVDAALSYDFGVQNPDWQGVSLQVNAKNLFDERKPVCTVGNCYWDEGRSVFGSLRYRF
ncbi:TonB-dependent siderophore receptor, partial [Rhizobiaceae sp. 2RAB30]